MEPDTQSLEQAIYGLAILSAIPVVLLALWGDYFERRVAQMIVEEPEFDQVSSLDDVKMACLCALISQILLFLGSSDIREAFPIISPLIFVVAVSSQILIQARAEGKIGETSAQKSDLAPKTNKRENVLRISLRATFCGALGIVVHVLFLGLMAGIVGVLIQKYQPTFIAGILALSVSGIAGLMSGILFNLALTPIYFKFIFPIRKLEEEELRKKLESCFSKYDLEPPELWALELNEIRITQNILVGIRGGRGKFRQALFISNLILSDFSEREIEALTLAQVSHIILKHPKRRAQLIFALISIAAVLALASVLIGQTNMADQPAVEMMGAVLSLTVFLGSFRLLFQQTQNHENESDLYTVEKLGVSLDVLSCALRKMDVLIEPNPTTIALISKKPLGFPETEKRIQQLEKSVQKSTLNKAA
jgi:Zn-dependent protease with chaperone function